MSTSNGITKERLEEIEAGVREVYKDVWEQVNRPKVTVSDDAGVITVVVSQMYEYVPVNLQILLALSKVFGTMEFDVNQWSSSGCETCDYGSNYSQEFSYKIGKTT